MAGNWLADLLGKTIMTGGITLLPDRKIMNFLGGDGASIVVADNPALGATDVTIGGATGTVGSGGVLLTGADNGKTLVNGAAVSWTLPTAALGLTFRFVNALVAGTAIHAAGSDVINFSTLASSIAGSFSTTDVYASVLLTGISGHWIAVGMPAGLWIPA